MIKEENMEAAMNTGKRTDYLDSLFYAAAKDACEKDIGEFKGLDNDTPLPAELSERIADIAEKYGDKQDKTTKKKGRFGIRRFAAIAAAAALLVCGLTIAGIAGKKQPTAFVVVSNAADKFVLTYDTSGIKADDNSKLPDGFPDDYVFVKEITDNDGNVGSVYQRDGVVYTYYVKKLDSDYSLVLGFDEDTEYFDFVVLGKYNGCVSVTASGEGQTSVACWNDGTNAFELYGNCSSDVICLAAQDLYG